MVRCIHAIERIGKGELNVSGPEAIRLLNCLNADVGDIVHICEWAGVLISAIRSPAAMETFLPLLVRVGQISEVGHTVTRVF